MNELFVHYNDVYKCIVDPDESQWMYMADRRLKEFIDGVHEFIEVAEKHKYGGFVHCPCKFCKNRKDYSSSRTIHSHLFSSGFLQNYYVWTKHGERGIMLDNNEEEEEDRISDFAANYGAFFMTLQWVSLKKILKDTL